MKRGGVLHILLLLTLLAPASLFAEKTTSDWESKIVEDFQPGANQHDWTAQGSRYVTPGYPKTAVISGQWPQALYGTNPANASQLRVLGVNSKFDEQGYNWIEIFPYKKDANGTIVPDPIPLPGRVSTLDLWVWGSNHDYTMDVELQDYQGVVYVLPLGSLNFPGWEDLQVNVPPSIPQQVTTIPSFRGLKLVKFVIWTRPRSDVSNFYVYLSHIKVLTNMAQSHIDGEGLASPTEIQKIWGQQGSKP